jgi:hypothetical protein
VNTTKPLKSLLPPTQYLLAASGLFAAFALLLKLPSGMQSQQYISKPRPDLTCQEIVQPKAMLSHEQLAKLLSVPEHSQRREVQEIVKQPYCRLPSLSIRSGAKTERDAYPLAFDPQTNLVILYEGKTYVGYGFQHD